MKGRKLDSGQEFRFQCTQTVVLRKSVRWNSEPKPTQETKGTFRRDCYVSAGWLMSVSEGDAKDDKRGIKRKFVEEKFGCTDRERFLLELEFVQCLANPQYLHWLGQNQWFEEPAFVNYLKYLRYWKKPKYSKYIIYPHALHFLDLLQCKEFRKSVARDSVKHYQENRFNEAKPDNATDDSVQQDE